MRHGLVFRRLGRNTSQLRALLRTLSTQLVEHERIVTTWPKAKEASRMADKLITWAKRDTEGSRSKIQSWLMKPSVTDKLMTTLRDRYKDRAGGYTRVLKYGFFPDDRSPRAVLEYVDNPLPSLRTPFVSAYKSYKRTPETWKTRMKDFSQRLKSNTAYVPIPILSPKRELEYAEKFFMSAIKAEEKAQPVVWKKPTPPLYPASRRERRRRQPQIGATPRSARHGGPTRVQTIMSKYKAGETVIPENIGVSAARWRANRQSTQYWKNFRAEGGKDRTTTTEDAASEAEPTPLSTEDLRRMNKQERRRYNAQRHTQAAIKAYEANVKELPKMLEAKVAAAVAAKAAPKQAEESSRS